MTEVTSATTIDELRAAIKKHRMRGTAELMAALEQAHSIWVAQTKEQRANAESSSVYEGPRAELLRRAYSPEFVTEVEAMLQKLERVGCFNLPGANNCFIIVIVHVRGAAPASGALGGRQWLRDARRAGVRRRVVVPHGCGTRACGRQQRGSRSRTQARA